MYFLPVDTRTTTTRPSGKQHETHMFEHGLGDGRRNDDPQAAGHFREHMPGALGNFLGCGRRSEFSANPFLILWAERRLRRDLLREKSRLRAGGPDPAPAEVWGRNR